MVLAGRFIRPQIVEDPFYNWMVYGIPTLVVLWLGVVGYLIRRGGWTVLRQFGVEGIDGR